MKKVFFTFCFALSTIACNVTRTQTPNQVAHQATTTDPKEAVAYVKATPPEDLRRLLLGLAMDQHLSERFRTGFMAYYVTGWSGSGFTIAGNGPHTRFVTNRHVANGSSEVYVSFDNKKTMIRGEIVYIDPEYDLAVVELPNHRPGLELKTTVSDLEDVRTVGYPGIGRNGNYQIARGSVTNSCVRGNAIGLSARQCWIQHNAPIDPGSSGGPLLSADSRVLGVNTLMLRRRNSFFLSVPSVHVASALSHADDILANRQDAKWMTAQLRTSCRKFVSEMSAKNTNLGTVIPSISYALVTDKGLHAFEEISDGKLADALKNAMDEDPLEAIQLAIYLSLQDTFVEFGGIQLNETCEHVNPNDDVLSGEDIRVDVQMREGHVELDWRFERGEWRLSGY